MGAPVIAYDPQPGMHIEKACIEAWKLAKLQDVEFTFNGVKVVAHPGDSPKAIQDRWRADSEAAHEAWLKSPERAERERKREEERRQKESVVMVESAVTEKEMHDAANPWPLTEKQLLEYIVSLIDRGHDYGTCCYAMSLAAVAAFNYVAGKLGVTGFQSSCADLDFLRRTRSMKGPFIILKAEDMVFPQYDLPGRLREAMDEWQPWVKEQAEKHLEETDMAHPIVIAHWKMLAQTKK